MKWIIEFVNKWITESKNQLIIKFKISFPHFYISTISHSQIVKMKI